MTNLLYLTKQIQISFISLNFLEISCSGFLKKEGLTSGHANALAMGQLKSDYVAVAIQVEASKVISILERIVSMKDNAIPTFAVLA